jgi:Flp pilus assembly protein TadG
MRILMSSARTARRSLNRLRADQSGLALIEFALALPLLLMVGTCGIELSWYALCNMRVSHAALDLADNATRIGSTNSSGTAQLIYETDINDVLQEIRLEGAGFNLLTQGRVTMSSLESTQDSSGNWYQRLHWQRCVGTQSTGYDSSYGVAPINDSGIKVTSMGDSSAPVTAPQGYGLIFVEINYLYTPLFGTMVIAPRQIHYTASMIIRDNRDLSSGITANNSTKQTCNLHNA